MRWVLTFLGIAMIVFGAIWFLQGIGAPRKLHDWIKVLGNRGKSCGTRRDCSPHWSDAQEKARLASDRYLIYGPMKKTPGVGFLNQSST